MYYNPAGLSLGAGTRLYIDGNFAWRTFSYTRPVGAIDNIQRMEHPTQLLRLKVMVFWQTPARVR